MTQVIEAPDYTDVTIGTFVYWYPHGSLKNDPFPAIVTSKIPATTGAADMTVFTRNGPEVRNAVHPCNSQRMDNINIRRNGGWERMK